MGLIGQKLGMTRLFDEQGRAIAVTLIQAGPNYVTQIKTPERDGYLAVQLGFKETRKLNRPARGHLKGLPPLAYLREVPLASPEGVQRGAVVTPAEVLRIVQEALTNVRKHAEANRVEVAFGARNGTLEILVKDDGKGFNPLAIKRGEWPHLGLQTMQERAEAIGGTFEIDSSPGKGTTVRVTLPIPAYPGAREVKT